jgi:HrpA-like RNA helicase
MFRIRYPDDLPITARREEIVATIQRHQVVILAGETGSGKTTQLPKMCLEAVPNAPGMIGCDECFETRRGGARCAVGTRSRLQDAFQR